MNKNLFFKGLAAVSLASAALIAYAEGNTIRIFQKNEKLDCEQIVAEFPASSIGHLQIDDISNAKEVFTVNGVSFTMIRVDGGSYQMGSSDPQAAANTKPAHTENVCTFYIGETEVTNALWKAVMGTKPSGQRNSGDDYPVTCITRATCYKFLKKLNLLTGRQFHLPNEVEWEYAARGGVNHTDNFDYSGSNDISEVAWYIDNSDISTDPENPTYTTHPVKGKKANQLGIYDMTGNVWEICDGKYRQSYASDAEVTSNFPIRGGSIENTPVGAYVITRLERESNTFSNIRGFRLVL